MESRIPLSLLRPFFLTIVVAVAIGLIIDTIFSSLIITNFSNSTNVGKIERLLSEKSRGDIPIFGSSITRRNYYPDSINSKIFNYGMPGALYTSIEPLIKIELEKDKESPIIIDYDHHLFFHDETNRIQSSNYIPFIENEHIREMLVETNNYDWHYEVPGMRYYGSYLDYIRDFFKPIFEKEEKINRGGVYFPYRPMVYEQFREKRIQMIEDLRRLRKKRKEKKELFTLKDEKEMEFLDKMLNFHPNQELISKFKNLVQDSDRLFILVYPPQNPIKLQGLDNYPEVIDLLKSLAEDHDNIAAIDMSDYAFDENLYKDSGHMNITGAKRFSTLLKPYFEKVTAEPITYSYVEVQ